MENVQYCGWMSSFIGGRSELWRIFSCMVDVIISLEGVDTITITTVRKVFSAVEGNQKQCEDNTQSASIHYTRHPAQY